MNALVKLETRLPYNPAIEAEWRVNLAQWKTLVESIYPNARSAESIISALSYCKDRGLDPFKRPIHIVAVYSSAKRAYIEQIWPGIAELRTTASRTSEYAGCDETIFGPTIKKKFEATSKDDRDTKDLILELEFPEWAQVTVYRVVKGARCPFVGPKIRWLSAYARLRYNVDYPNDVWARRAFEQLDKCAEAAALRKAFPEELGGMLSAEELHDQTVSDGGAPIIPGFAAVRQIPQQPFKEQPDEGEVINAEYDEVPPADDVTDPALAILNKDVAGRFDLALATCDTPADFVAMENRWQWRIRGVAESERGPIREVRERHRKRIQQEQEPAVGAAK
jgi:phage recombination protein Bet